MGTDPSADSGAKTEGGGTMPPCLRLRDWHQCAKSILVRSPWLNSTLTETILLVHDPLLRRLPVGLH